jgi:hypothetical protein
MVAGSLTESMSMGSTMTTVASALAQIDKLACADCSAGGMMGSTCVTGTTVAGHRTRGTMNGELVSQVVTAR